MQHPGGSHELTPRQIQILGLATFSNNEIAYILNVSAQTVKNHWSNIYRYLGLTPRAGESIRLKAIIIALERGLIPSVWDLPLGSMIKCTKRLLTLWQVYDKMENKEKCVITATPQPRFYPESCTLAEHQILKRIRQLVRKGRSILILEIVSRDSVRELGSTMME